jgi:glyoxylase-like metal-dependent hydrolase (beta-lactamase superfamily II)
MYATRLSDRALVITGDYAEEHMTVLATGEGLIVVDTLGTLPATRAALPLVEQFSREPVRYLVNTHLDADHVAGNAAFAGAAILAHANGTKHLDERLYDDPASEQSVRAFVDQVKASEVPADPILAARRQTYIDIYSHVLGGFGDFTAAPPVVFVPDGTRLVLGRTELQLRHFGPGHTDADLVVVAAGDDLVLTGDVALGAGLVPIAHRQHGGSLVGLAGALEQVEALTTDATRIVPGHGAIGGRALVRAQRAYVEGLLAAVGEAQARGLTLDEARPALDLEAFSQHLLYDLVHPGHVELAWQEVAARGDRVVE